MRWYTSVYSVKTCIVLCIVPPSKPHSRLCNVQYYCLNYGTCYVLIPINRTYCEWVRVWSRLLPWRTVERSVYRPDGHWSFTRFKIRDADQVIGVISKLKDRPHIVSTIRVVYQAVFLLAYIHHCFRPRTVISGENQQRCGLTLVAYVSLIRSITNRRTRS